VVRTGSTQLETNAKKVVVADVGRHVGRVMMVNARDVEVKIENGRGIYYVHFNVSNTHGIDEKKSETHPHFSLNIFNIVIIIFPVRASLHERTAVV
jgi:hypothetical protein